MNDARTGVQTLPVGGLVEPNALLGCYLAGSTFFRPHVTHPPAIAVLAQTAGDMTGVDNPISTRNRSPTVGAQTEATPEKSRVERLDALPGFGSWTGRGELAGPPGHRTRRPGGRRRRLNGRRRADNAGQGWVMDRTSRAASSCSSVSLPSLT